jgi:hypothetical protein
MTSARRSSAGRFLPPASNFMPRVPRLTAAEAEAMLLRAGSLWHLRWAVPRWRLQGAFSRRGRKSSAGLTLHAGRALWGRGRRRGRSRSAGCVSRPRLRGERSGAVSCVQGESEPLRPKARTDIAILPEGVNDDRRSRSDRGNEKHTGDNVVDRHRILVNLPLACRRF